MEDKNISLVNEAQTLLDCADQILGISSRLTPDRPDVNYATVRSLNTQADALRNELFNLQKLIDEYNQ